MQSRSQIQRDESAASAAIATVMMFAGVLSIISLMLLSIVPVINELEGAIEASDARAQFEDLSELENQLASRGLPGSTTEMRFNPVNGDLGWRLDDGGVWFSSTWNDGQHLRLRDATDLDAVFDIRYPFGSMSAYCVSDLHIASESEWRYRLPDMTGEVLFTLAAGSSSGLFDSKVVLTQGASSLTYELGAEAITAVDLPLAGQSGEATLVSTHELTVLLDRGLGGASIIAPIDADHLGSGSVWRVPLPIGTNTVSVFAASSFLIVTTVLGVTAQSSASVAGDGAEWQNTFTVSSATVLTVETSKPARLLLKTSDTSVAKGSATWPGDDGSFLSSSFLVPRLSGTLVVYNPTASTVMIDVQGADYSVPASGTLRIAWPQSGTVGTIALTSGEPVMLYWTAEPSSAPGGLPAGLDYAVAEDTGMRSGQSFGIDWSGADVASGDARLHVIPAGSSVTWSMSGVFTASGTHITASTASVLISSGEGAMSATVSAGHALRLLRSAGDDGAIQLLENGQERCLPLSIQASGWVTAVLPWKEVFEPTLTGLRTEWDAGTHPSGIHVQVLGTVADSDFSVLADAWATHLPVLRYDFTSSITGLEVVNRGGIVATNHPEQNPHLLHSALSSRGEGGLLGIQLPVTMPTTDSLLGGSAEVKLRLEMVHRTICSQESAYDVRMGWYGPYGDAVVQWLAQDLSHSDDWVAFPEQFDRLNDYLGWVDRPGGEAVYHSPSAKIDLSLSMTSISYTAKAVGG